MSPNRTLQRFVLDCFGGFSLSTNYQPPIIQYPNWWVYERPCAYHVIYIVRWEANHLSSDWLSAVDSQADADILYLGYSQAGGQSGRWAKMLLSPSFRRLKFTLMSEDPRTILPSTWFCLRQLFIFGLKMISLFSSGDLKQIQVMEFLLWGGWTWLYLTYLNVTFLGCSNKHNFLMFHLQAKVIVRYWKKNRTSVKTSQNNVKPKATFSVSKSLHPPSITFQTPLRLFDTQAGDGLATGSEPTFGGVSLRLDDARRFVSLRLVCGLGAVEVVLIGCLGVPHSVAMTWKWFFWWFLVKFVRGACFVVMWHVAFESRGSDFAMDKSDMFCAWRLVFESNTCELGWNKGS